MRISLLGTAALSALALALGCLTAPAGAVEPDRNSTWSGSVSVGPRDWAHDLMVAPDGSAQLQGYEYGPNDCPACVGPYPYQRTAYGAWQPAAAGDLAQAFDSQSRAWATYTAPVTSDTTQLKVHFRPSGGTWSAPEDVPGAVLSAAATQGGLVLTPDDRPVVSWAKVDGSGGRTLFTAERRADGTWLTATHPVVPTVGGISMVATSNGGLRVASGSGESVIIAERTADGTWLADKTLHVAEGGTSWPGEWVTPTTLVTTTSSGDVRGVAAIDLVEGSWQVYPLGTRASGGPGPVHGVDASGVVTIAWVDPKDNLVTVTRPRASAWSRPTKIASSAYGASLTTDPAGTVTLAWSGDSGRSYVRQLPAHSPRWYKTRLLPPEMWTGGDNGQVEVGSAASGRVTLVSSFRSMEITPPVAFTALNPSPYRGWADLSYFRLGWYTTWATATSHDVRYRTRAVTGTTSVQRSFKSATNAREETFHGRAGRVYCFSARAHTATKTGPWSKDTCVGTPLSARSLKVSKGWTRAAGTLNSRTKGATLTTPRLHGTRFAMLVRPAAGGGVVRVTLGGHRLGTYRLTPGHQLIGLKAFKRMQHGKLVVTVASSGKPVRIDRIYAR